MSEGIESELGRAIDGVAESLERVFVSPNVCDSNLESANLVDTTQSIANALNRIAKALETLAAAVEKKG